MEVKRVYFQVGNTISYRIPIGFTFQQFRSKFSVVFLAASNSVLVFVLIVPLRVSVTIDI